jgi:beta-N-acetylhexosaminidase
MPRAALAVILVALLLPAPARAETFGHSADGRALSFQRAGDPAAPVHVLVTGSIHGNETAGQRIIRCLARLEPPAGVQLWLVRTANPDGVAAGTRQNARGVDLNRNFPFRWRSGGRPFDTYYPGPARASEPETSAMRDLVERIHPDLSVHYHQHMDLISLPRNAEDTAAREYARRVGMRGKVLPAYRGTLTSWQNHTHPGTSAFVVELPAGQLTRRQARRHARAVLGVAPPPAVAEPAQAAPEPDIDWDPIPFGRTRQRQMRGYSERHYGERKAKLADPKVIVEHYTVSTTYSSVWNTFAANAPDVEFGERPGVCSHYVIERDGTIHQLVSLRWRCRHTVGLNQTAIGIEHVGVSDADVMGRKRQLRASLALTRYLQDRFGIRTRDVIGHAESLSSPYHHELVKAMRNRTHGDFAHATMERYRAKL